MTALKLILFFLSVFAPGYLLEKLWLKSRESFLFKLALAWSLGAILITLELFCLFFLLQLKINLFFFYLFLIAESTLLFYLINKNQSGLNFKNSFNNWRLKLAGIKFNRPKINIGKIIIFILILIQIIFLSLNALARPSIAYDNLTTWQYKPKILFYEKQIAFDERQDDFLGGGSHLNYPWQVPLLSYWLYANLGDFNDLAGNLINLIYYFAILITIYYFLKKYLADLISLIFVWLAATMPLLFYHGFNGYADLILSYYLLLAFIFLFYWLEKGETKQLLAAGIFLGCTLFIKNDALIFIMAGFLIVLIKLLIIDKKFLHLLKFGAFYLLAIILPLLPWLFIKIKYNLSFRNVEPGISYHGEVWQNIFGSLFLSNSFNIWWFVVVISLIINIIKITKQNQLLLAWLFLIFCLGGLLVLYLFTGAYHFAIDNTALSRNILTLIPISVVLAARSYGQINSQT